MWYTVGETPAGVTPARSVLCRIETYVEIISWSSTMYVFIWMCMDRHTALERPSRYDVEQSETRLP